MKEENYNIDEETITKVGLQSSDIAISGQIAPNTRVFAYPHLDNVFVMESDLYGNVMPKNSCFLVFSGQHGFIGKKIKVETLKNASPEDVQKIIHSNEQG